MTSEAFLSRHRGRRNWEKLFMAILFLAGDIFSILFSFGTAFFIINLFRMEDIDFKSFVTYWPYLPAFLILLYLLHMYPGVNISQQEELRRFAIASFMGHGGIILSLYIQNHKLDIYSSAFVLSCILSVPIFLMGRSAIRKIFIKAKYWGIPVVVLGAGVTGKMLVDRLLDKSSIGYRPVVMLDDNAELQGEYRGIPVLKGLELSIPLAKECNFETALVAMPGVGRERLSVIIADYVRNFRSYFLVPDYFGVTNLWMSVRDIDGILTVQTEQQLLLSHNIVLKRIFDIVLSFLGGLVSLPLCIFIAILIKLDSPGPVIYVHNRRGKGGRLIKVYKFRTMYQNSKEMLEKILRENPELQNEWQINFKLKNDPRITPIGRFLRKTSLDELPQLWNVFKGDMSLIGPRPIIDDEIKKYGDNYLLLASVKPGLSGLWQISGRSETDYEERVAMDIYYIQSWSLWLDLYILFKTFAAVIKGKGAY